MSCREGRADPEMRSAKRTTLCRALQSWFVALPYHTEMHLSQKLITKHQWLVHSLYGQRYLKITFPPLLQQFWSVWNDCIHMYKSLVFGDEFLAQCLHLKSHQRCSAGIRTWLSADSQVLPHWLNHNFSLILALYTEIDTGPVQTVAIKLEAHNSLEYHYILKH